MAHTLEKLGDQDSWVLIDSTNRIATGGSPHELKPGDTVLLRPDVGLLDRHGHWEKAADDLVPTRILADDAPQRGRCGPAMRLKHAAVMGELQRVVFAGSQLRASDESGGGRCWYGQGRRQQDSVAGVDAAMVLHVDRNVAASVTYQDVGGSGSGCNCVVGETGPDDNRRRWGRYQRLTPVVALRIHSPEVRS